MTEMPPDLAVPGLHAILAQQRKAARNQPYPSYAQRRRDLWALRAALGAYQDELVAAMSADFGRRSEFECKMLDVMGPALQIDHALAHLRRWMAPRPRSADLLFFGNDVRVLYQPKGVVGVIAAWNFPVVESLGPLVTALASGNRVMIKMSEYSPRCTEVLRKLLGELFRLDQVAVFGGDVEVGRAFSALAFDHIVFTGSPEVGKQIMGAASANLTPVTLELGGKSPAIVARSADIGAAGASIAHGKAFNSGQACVAPDYVLIDPAQIDAFVGAAKAAFSRMYPSPASDPQYTMMASDRHAERVRSLLDDAQAKGGVVHACAGGDGDRVIPLHIVTGATPAMRIMQEELFNPILPVVACASLDAAIAFVQERPRPLALYYYGSDRAEMARLERETHAGGMSYNDWAWHVFQCDLPFGGSGNSGIGSWRGPEGFCSLSHAKSVFSKRRWFPSGLFRPPYGRWPQRAAMRIFLGR